MEFTIIIEIGENGYFVGQFKDYPEIQSQGKTIDELKENLIDAFRLFFNL